jgi:hypothetical protein
MTVQFNDEAPWGDCNKCGAVDDVNPQSRICEYCGCNDPSADYPDAVWVVGQNPFAKAASPSDIKLAMANQIDSENGATDTNGL